jgi:hypothetical protein
MKSLFTILFTMVFLSAGIAGAGQDKAATAEVPMGKSTTLCRKSERAHFTLRYQFGFCYPRAGWDLDQGAPDPGAQGLCLRNRTHPAVSIHFQVSVIPATYTGRRRHSEYEQDVVNELLQLDPHPRIRRRLIERRDAMHLELTAKNTDGTPRSKSVILLYISPEEMLHMTLSYSDEVREPALTVFERLVSSLVIKRTHLRQEKFDEMQRMRPR